jgi:predicted dehydrogenase
MGLVGGGGAGFIGGVHFLAATLDHQAELVCGALSSDPLKARQEAARFGLAAERAYGSYQELIQAESRLDADRRPDFLAIATPNYLHFAIASAALQAGLNVVCDKPLATSVDQAEQLVRLVEQTGAVLALMHNYSGYPLARQIRQMVRQGELGVVQAVRVHYLQGGLRGLRAGQTPPRAAWKADPDKAGPSGAMADIGTHAFHLLRFTTGLVPTEVSCQLGNFHPVRPLDDYGHAVLRFGGGGLGTITVSQVTHGRMNDLSLEIDGTAGSLAWRQESPNELLVRRHGRPVQIYAANPRVEYLDDVTRSACRLPGGHPEGFFEAFANVYRDCFRDILRRTEGGDFDRRDTLYPNVYDGLEGVRYVAACLASHGNNGAWQPLGPPADTPRGGASPS